MATKFWVGKAASVAQVTTVTVGGTLSGETFTLSVNGIEIASVVDTDTSPDTVRAALVVAWNASAHPYSTGVTAADGAGTGELTLTGAVAGVPFVVTLNTPGASATFGQVATTAATGPNHWDDADNWSDGVVPVSGDDVIFRSSAVSVAWGLDQNAVELDSLRIEQTYTGRIGLNRNAFATSADGQTVSTSATEYRDDYLRIGFDDCWLGEQPGPGSPNGSQRLKIDCTQTTGTPRVEVFNTAGQPAETGLPAVRLLFANANAELHCRKGVAGIGVAIDEPTETTTLGLLTVAGSAKVYVGSGTTLTTFEQNGGESRLNLAATLATLKLWGGTLRTEGDYTITAATVYGGAAYFNHVKTSGNAITTLGAEGGEVDMTESLDDRTFATVNLAIASRLRFNADHLTITNLNPPSAGEFVLTPEAAI